MLIRTTAPVHPDQEDFHPSGLLSDPDTSALAYGDQFFSSNGNVHFCQFFGKVTIRDQRGSIWMSHWGFRKTDDDGYNALVESDLALAEERARRFLADNELEIA